MVSYIKKHMSNYGFEKEILIVKDEKEYIDKINDIELEESVDKIVNTLLILQV